MIIILGGSGMVGSAIIQSLQKLQRSYWAPNRKELTELDSLNTKITPDTIVINAIGIAPGFGEKKNHEVYIAQKQFLDRCIELGVTKIISLSALSQYPKPSEIPYLKYKYLLDEHLLKSNVTTYIVRPSLIYSEQGASTQFFKKLSKLPILAFPKNPNFAVSPIDIEDLTNFIIKLIELDLPSQIFEVGSGKISMSNYFKAFNHKIIICPLPEWMMAISMNALGVVLPSIAGKYAFALLRSGSINQRDDYTSIMGEKAKFPLHNDSQE